MPVNNAVPVSEAASALEVHPSRIRAMVSAGQLEAQKVAGRWFIDRSSLERRHLVDPGDGRPFSPANAWALLCLAEGESVDWVSQSALSRLRNHLKHRSLDELAPKLRSRARMMRLRGHSSALDRIADEPGVVRAGASAAKDVGIDIQANGELEVYVSDRLANELVRKYHLEPSDRPNVLFRVVSEEVPFIWQDCVGPAVAAVDLIESVNARSRRAGKEYLSYLGQSRHRSLGSSTPG